LTLQRIRVAWHFPICAWRWTHNFPQAPQRKYALYCATRQVTDIPDMLGRRTPFIAVLFLLSVLGKGESLAAAGTPLDGQVLDYDTGQPIAGAIVVRKWSASRWRGESISAVCTHVETAASLDDGRFHFSAWADGTLSLAQEASDPVAYKAGYESAHPPLNFVRRGDGTWVVFRSGAPSETLGVFADEASARAATHPNNAYLKPSVGGESARLIYLQNRVFSGMDCREAGQSLRNLYPLFKSAYDEARTLAVTQEDRRLISSMANTAARAWLGSRSVDDPLFVVPKEICRELGGSEPGVSHNGRPMVRFAGEPMEEPPCK